MIVSEEQEVCRDIVSPRNVREVTSLRSHQHGYLNTGQTRSTSTDTLTRKDANMEGLTLMGSQRQTKHSGGC